MLKTGHKKIEGTAICGALFDFYKQIKQDELVLKPENLGKTDVIKRELCTVVANLGVSATVPIFYYNKLVYSLKTFQ